MTEQGTGGYAVIQCHSCRQPVAFDTGTPLHLDDTPLCAEHLPECWTKFPELRACEKRLLESRPDPGISEKQAIANYAIYQNGYAFGLGKAREAVAALLAYDSPYGPLIRTVAALAAIDALKEKQ